MTRGASDPAGLRLSVLGPLRLEIDGRTVEVPGSKRRAVVALLAMAAPDGVSTDRLIDAVWPDEAPGSRRAALQSHISRIRRHLGAHADRLRSTGFGYRLAIEPDELDAERCSALVREATERATTNAAAAVELLAEARALWRGTPLDDLSHISGLAAWSRALTEQHHDAGALLVEYALSAGQTRTALSVAAELAAANPLDERFAILVVRSLAARGRGPEALRAAHQFRERLAEETGLEATAALAAAEHRVAAGGERTDTVEPPSPRTHDDVPPFATLIGREAELAGLERLLATERLVTIVGPGGVGKTHLATEVAHRAAATIETVVVRLDPLGDGSAIPDVLARALGLRIESGDLLDRCIARLASAPHLLVLDNCEHLLDPVRAVVTRVLGSTSSVSVLATSRERLAIPTEQTCRLAPLPMPAPNASVDRRPASVALFLDRARRIRPDLDPGPEELASIGHIIRAVDGLPLAIELAAGRLASLAVNDIEARLDRALDLMARNGSTDGPPDRHRTLRASIAWSYDLLPAEEQRLFRSLAMFADGFDLDTAETLALDLGTAGDPVTLLAHLVDASMVVADLDTGPRYRMLDSLRRFALDRLDSTGERDAASRRLRQWAVDLLEWFDRTAGTDEEPAADRRLRREIGNLRAAWTEARSQDDIDTTTELVSNLFSAIVWRDLTELHRWPLELVDDPRLLVQPRRARVLALAAEAAWYAAGDLDRAESLAVQACEQVDPGDSTGRVMASWALGDVLLFRGRYDDARQRYLEVREQPRWTAEGSAGAAMAAAYAGDLDDARSLLDDATATASSPRLRAWASYTEGEVEGLEGNWDTAERAYRQAIDLAITSGSQFVEGVASLGLLSAVVAAGDVQTALVGYRELISRWEWSGSWVQQWTTLRNVADLLDQLGDHTTAERLWASADAAPEAPPLSHAERRADPPRPESPAPLDRQAALDLARSAITRALESA